MDSELDKNLNSLGRLGEDSRGLVQQLRGSARQVELVMQSRGLPVQGKESFSCLDPCYLYQMATRYVCSEIGNWICSRYLYTSTAVKN